MRPTGDDNDAINKHKHLNRQQEDNKMKDVTYKLLTLGVISVFTVVWFTACGQVKPAKAKTEQRTRPADIAQEFVIGDKTAGGWTVAEDTNLTPDQLDVFDQAMEGYTGVGYEPVAYLGSQLVSGTNHCYLCKATVVYPNATPEYSLVYIYESLNDKPAIANITDINLPGTSRGAALGAWSCATDPAITPELKAVVEKAAVLGAEYEPIANIASQLVSGTNHAILCRITPVAPNAESHFAVVYIYENLEGQCNITDTADITFSLDAQ